LQPLTKNPPGHDRVILYPSFGPGPHVEEVIYSALSAVYKSDIHPTARVVIFTDNPKPSIR